MAIWLNEDSKILVQGMTGSEGTKHTRRMVESGAKVVAGVTPGKAGADVDGIPVFNDVASAIAATGANVSVIFVPPKFCLKHSGCLRVASKCESLQNDSKSETCCIRNQVGHVSLEQMRYIFRPVQFRVQYFFWLFIILLLNAFFVFKRRTFSIRHTHLYFSHLSHYKCIVIQFSFK